MILSEIQSQLAHIARDENKENLDLTSIMHLVAFLKLPGLMTILVRIPPRRPAFVDINAENPAGQTPLHMAALTGNLEAVEVLIGQPTLRGAEEDKSEQTALELAQTMERRIIVRKLMQREDVKEYVHLLQGDRTFLVNGANAILVGATLIASVTFGGSLQPPLGYQQNYKYPRAGGPSEDFRQYAAINEYTSMKVFWIANGLSFYLSIASILAATGSVAPRRGVFIRAEVKRLWGGIRLCGFFFAWAVLCVVMAFIAAGFAAVPPEIQYRLYVICTLVVGVFVGCSAFNLARAPDPFTYIQKTKYADLSFYLDTLISKIIRRKSGRQEIEQRKTLYDDP